MSDDEEVTFRPAQKRRATEQLSDSDSFGESDHESVTNTQRKRRLRRRENNEDDLELLKENFDERDSIQDDDENEDQYSDRAEEGIDQAYDNTRDFRTEPLTHGAIGDDNFIDDENEDEETNYLQDSTYDADQSNFVNEAVEIFGRGILQIINSAAVEEYEVPEEEEEEEEEKEEEEKIQTPIEDLDALRYALQTPRDIKLRTEDISERMAIDYEKCVDMSEANEDELNKEVSFILKELNYTEEEQNSVSGSIYNALFLFHHSFMEPAYIQRYKKDYVNIGDISNLYKIYQQDIEYRKALKYKETVRSSLKQLESSLSSIQSTYIPIYIHEYTNEQGEMKTENILDIISHLLIDIELDLDLSNSEDSIKHIQQYILALQDIIEDNNNNNGNITIKHKKRGSNKNIYERKMLELACNYSVDLSHIHENIKQRGCIYAPTIPQQPLSSLCPSYAAVPEEPANVTLMNSCKTLAYIYSNNNTILDEAKMLYTNYSLLSSKPTNKGVEDIDILHHLYGIHRIHNKPIASIHDDLLIKLNKGKEDGLIDYHIDCPEGLFRLKLLLLTCLCGHEDYFIHIHPAQSFDDFKYIINNDNSKTEEERKELFYRVRAVFIACDLIHKQLLREVKDSLLKKGNQYIAMRCCAELKKLLCRKPFVVPQLKNTNKHSSINNVDDYITGTVLSISFSTDNSIPSSCVYINREGELVDYVDLFFNRLSLISEEQELIRRIKKIYIDQKPDIVILNTHVGMTSKRYQTFIERIIRDCEDNESIPSVRCVLINDNIPRLKGQSDQGIREFPDYTDVMRIAIYMARYIQDSMYEIASLFNDPVDVENNDILQLELYQYQDEINPAYLYTLLSREMVTRVAERGIFINQVISQKYKQDILQFLPGLGPRKARQLIQYLQTVEYLSSREDLKDSVLTEKVYRDCIGFILLDHITTYNSSSNPFDYLLIHPDDYEVAFQICERAVSSEDDDDEARFNSALQVIQDAIDHRHKPDEAITDLISQMNVEQMKKEEKYAEHEFTIDYLVNALRANFYEGPYEEIWEDIRGKSMVDNEKYEEGMKELFYLLIGERENTFRVGTQLIATIKEFKSNTNSNYDSLMSIKCQLDNGLFGYINKYCYSDQDNVNNNIYEQKKRDGMNFGMVPFDWPIWRASPQQLSVGDKIDVRIFAIRYSQFSCTLTCRTSQLTNPELVLESNGLQLNQLDPFYQRQRDPWEYAYIERIENERKQKIQERELQTQKRTILHPNFMNANRTDVEAYLQDKTVGEAIFRPSRQGIHYLTLTMKIKENNYAHVTIEERPDSSTRLVGGKEGVLYIIEGQEYKDLDEILVRYVDNIQNVLENLYLYEKYLDCGQSEADAYVTSQHLSNPQRTSYCICLSEKKPLYISITFYKAGVHHDYARITPNGLFYKNLLFPSATHLISWFKKHFDDKVLPSLKMRH
ncbi:hypothetical protein WA158_007842 [Blastocystis sp. Blastoise]